ncbi:MAG TPA: histidine kinase [Symbiobacteriaceae bacterium]|nr:histidine kinase [Symbiobacteriaceae bacterium]
MSWSLRLLSLTRPVIMVVVLGVYMVSEAVSYGGMALFVVSAAFFIATSSVLVGWIAAPRRWRSIALWGELALITWLVFYASTVHGSEAMRTLYCPWAVTLPLEADRRHWRPGFVLVALSLLIGSAPDWFHIEPQTALFVLSIYGIMTLFFGSMGVLLRSLQDAQEESRKLLAEVTESRAALERTHRQLQETAARQQEMAVLQERQRLAREIHDSVAHGLTALVVQTQAARKLLDRDPARAAETIARCEGMAREALQETRRAVRALHPAGLEQHNCVDALGRLARDYGAATGMVVTIVADEPSRTMRPDVNRLEQLYRICQEALTNAHRHGRATTAQLDLSLREGILQLHITNDGERPANLDPGVGLKSMAERASSVGGSVSFEPLAHGLSIHVAIPMAAEQEGTG